MADSNQCGTCIFARPLNAMAVGAPEMSCFRYPPTPVPVMDKQTGRLMGTHGAIYPIVMRQTPSCGEYQPKVTQ